MTRFHKLPNGEWGIATDEPDLYIGQTLTVTKRDGTTTQATIKRILSPTLAEIGGTPRERPVPIPPITDARLFAYQRTGAHRLLTILQEYRGALLADEMGLGKTVQALQVAQRLGGRTLIVCSATLRENWCREVQRWTGQTARIMTDAIPPCDVVIVSYERALRQAAILKAQPWTLLIVDEAHRLKNAKGKQNNAILGNERLGKRGIADNCKHILLLTGTPLLASPIDAQPLLAACSFRHFGVWRYLERYCGAHRERVSRRLVVWKFDGATNLAELAQMMRDTVMVRRSKVEVLADLPPKHRQTIVLDATDAHEVLATEACAIGNVDIDTLIENAPRYAFGEIGKAREQVGLVKAPHVIEHARQALSESTTRKLLIFAHHHSVLDILTHAFPQSVTIDGRTENRQELVDRFQTDSQTRVAILGIQVAGVGVTLTQADLVIFAELDWTPAILTQCEDRAHRIGQTRPVTIQHLVYAGSIDARIVRKLLDKQAIADTVLNTVPVR